MTETETIRTLIVDDEPLARRKIRTLLAHDSEIEIVGECSGGNHAVSLISEKRPDLVFLDIQMPGMNAFEVIERLDPARTPLIVFVTAYDQYAVRAFECCALDYVLKPVNRKRFGAALEKAKSRIGRENRAATGEQTREMIQQFKAAPKYLERLAVKTNDRVILLKVEEIDRIEAEGKYIRIQAGSQSHLLREGISQIESRLDPSRFFRVHRSAIVNLDRIRELQPWFNGDYRIILSDGAELMLSRSSRKKLAEILGNRI